MQWWDLVDKIIFINLDHRTDRMENMNKFFQEAGIPAKKIIRFSAIRDSPGIVGAARSHISVLKMIIANGWENALILEDDVQWVNYSNETILEHIQNSFDVLMLGGLYYRTEGNRVITGFHTCSYIIKKHYVSTLLHNFMWGLRRLVTKTHVYGDDKIMAIKTDNMNHIDVFWCILQKRDNWRCIIPAMVTQIDSYSDNIGA